MIYALYISWIKNGSGDIILISFDVKCLCIIGYYYFTTNQLPI